MKRFLDNVVYFEQKYPGASGLFLWLHYYNSAGIIAGKEDLKKHAPPNYELDKFLAQLQESEIITTVLIGQKICYQIRNLEGFCSLRLNASQKLIIMNLLKEIVKTDDAFNTEVAHLEYIVRKFPEKLANFESLKTVLKGLVGTSTRSLLNVTLNDINILLSRAYQKNVVEAAAIEKKAARMVYKRMTDKDLKQRLLRTGISHKHLKEFIVDCIGQEPYNFEAVLSELQNMPVKFKFTQE